MCFLDLVENLEKYKNKEQGRAGGSDLSLKRSVPSNLVTIGPKYWIS